MQAYTQFSLSERVWAFRNGDQNKQIIEVSIDTINIEFDIDNDGKTMPLINYKIHTPSGDDWYVSEHELFKDVDDFLEKMKGVFEEKKVSFPKILPNLSSTEITNVA